jgi:hypothetical protein
MSGIAAEGKSMHIPRRALVISGAAAVILAGGATAAYASIPDGNGVIHGCYLKSDGNLKVIDSATQTCKSDEKALNWNQAGPAGPSTAGPSGLDVVTVDGPAGDQSIAYCPADNPYVLGGGYSTYNYEVIASFPVGNEGSSGNGWEVQTANYPNGSPASAYAICSK